MGKNRLKGLGAHFCCPTTGEYGRSGVPDIVGCYQGAFFGIECKASKGTTTPLQKKNLEDIGTAGGLPLLVNEENMHDVSSLLIDRRLSPSAVNS